MKKILSVTLAILLVAMSSTIVSAHGHSRHRQRAVSYSVCSAIDCTLTGQHQHNGRDYAAHYYGDGHNYHAYCEVESCDVAGYHSHDGLYCFGYPSNRCHN